MMVFSSLRSLSLISKVIYLLGKMIFRLLCAVGSFNAHAHGRSGTEILPVSVRRCLLHDCSDSKEYVR